LSELLHFAGDHPFWSFGIAWIVAEFLKIVMSRTYRLLMVVSRGWPPEHLDADGDWKTAEPENNDDE
jgi:hypothetical protein